jgi:hypothetical protein
VFQHPIAEDLDEDAPDSEAEEDTPISEEASGQTNKFERFPDVSLGNALGNAQA